jgi:hypothetical protein
MALNFRKGTLQADYVGGRATNQFLKDIPYYIELIFFKPFA